LYPPRRRVAAEMSYVFRRSCTQLSSATLRWPSPPTICLKRRLQQTGCTQAISRSFQTTNRFRKELQDESARETNQRDLDAHEDEVKAGIEAATKAQIKRPWQREGADKPPVDEESKRLNKAMTKGRRTLMLLCGRIEPGDLRYSLGQASS
jgi:calcium uniporter protein, mitochondrial